jgi:hypothetical protein
LNYTGGSTCGANLEQRRLARRAALPKQKKEPDETPFGNLELGEDYKHDPYAEDRVEIVDGDGEDYAGYGDDDDNTPIEGLATEHRRKSTVISFLCQTDKMVPASISFVSTDPDHCAYFFEMRTTAACAILEAEEQTVGPTGVFGLM